MAVTYYALLTTIGAGKLANATALGTTLKITQLAVGDGGGNVPNPDASRTQLVNEVRRAPLNRLSVDPANSAQIIAEQVIPEDVGGWWIREMGLYDEAGALIAYANCAPSYKPQLAEGSGRTQTVRIVLIVSNAASVELKIDPSVVLATREYVDSAFLTRVASATSLGVVKLATAAEVQAGTEATHSITPATLATRTATETRTGLVELASAAEVQAKIDTTRVVTPAGLSSCKASETASGLVELATNAETASGTDAERAITPLGLTARTATETRTGLVELASAAEVQAKVDTTRVVTPAGLASCTASETASGLVELATIAETVSGADAERAVTPAGLSARTATDTRAGLVELATAAEVQAKTDTARAITPAGLAACTATETRAGLVELATTAEAAAGTDTERAVTPAGLASGISSRFSAENVWRSASVVLNVAGAVKYERLPTGLVRMFGTVIPTGNSEGKGTVRVNFPFALSAVWSVVATEFQAEATVGSGIQASPSVVTGSYVDICFKTLPNGALRIEYQILGSV
ncbi:phage tail protein [Pseudomonas nitroreducens]|uniref:phage tail protein n=1 Tax=Pseudomonas nitroreducens TaxID=46680 RepID=UPI00209ECE82|nr:phage tail protein [Pseudomonas nitroreducens]MCP1622123.1 phage-related tail fiber protein [Pseudomonas nitroreducens]